MKILCVKIWALYFHVAWINLILKWFVLLGFLSKVAILRILFKLPGNSMFVLREMNYTVPILNYLLQIFFCFLIIFAHFVSSSQDHFLCKIFLVSLGVLHILMRSEGLPSLCHRSRTVYVAIGSFYDRKLCWFSICRGAWVSTLNLFPNWNALFSQSDRLDNFVIF